MLCTVNLFYSVQSSKEKGAVGIKHTLGVIFLTAQMSDYQIVILKKLCIPKQMGEIIFFRLAKLNILNHMFLRTKRSINLLKGKSYRVTDTLNKNLVTVSHIGY